MTEHNPVVSRIGQRGAHWMASTAPGWQPAIGVIGRSEHEVRSQYRRRIINWAALGLRLSRREEGTATVR